MPRHQGVWRQEWDVCDRCGFPHPIGMLQMQRGRKMCQCHGCLDDLSALKEVRDKIISDSIANSEEGKSDKPEKFRDPGEIFI